MLDMQPPTFVSTPRSAARHPFLVIVPLLVCVAAGLFIGFAREPVYTASARLSVGRIDVNAPGALAGFSSATQSLASAYSRAVDADPVVGSVASLVQLSADSVRSRVSASPIPDSPVFLVEAKTPTASQSVRLANASADALIKYVQELNRANPDSVRLFDQFQEASAEYARRMRAERMLKAQLGRSTGVAEAVGATEAALLRRETLRTAYLTSQQGQAQTSLIQRLALASDADSDRLRWLQISGFGGLLAGLVMGLGLATIRANRRQARAHRRRLAEARVS